MAKAAALGMLKGEKTQMQHAENRRNAMKEKQAKLLERAVALAVKAHAGQRDKSGEPYIFHSLRMMLRCHSFEEKLVSILHDVVEDTDYTIKDLRNEGCPEEVLIAIEHLSRRNDESRPINIRRKKRSRWRMADTQIALEEQFEDLEQQKQAATLGMWTFLATEVLFFGGLFMSYILYRNYYAQAFREAARHTILLYGTVNTAIL